jgi:hypothetical protein
MSTSANEKIFNPSDDDNVPTTVRIAAVGYYVNKEPILIPKLRPEMVKVRKRDGTTESFGIDVFEIACFLHKEGRDALKIGKADILAVAHTHLGVSAPSATAKPHTPSISSKGAEMAASAVFNLLHVASSLESTRKGGDSQVVSQLNNLIREMGFSGEPETPAVVPYTLVLSAGQLAEIHPTLVKFKPQLDAISTFYQGITLGDK